MTPVRREHPLRVKLVAIVLLLSGLGLALSAGVSATMLHGYLQDRVDEQLVGYTRGGPLDQRGPRGDRFTSVYVRYTDVAGQVVEVVPEGVAGPRLGSTVSSQPSTVAARSGDDDWRVIAFLDRAGNPFVIGLSLHDVSSTTRRLVLLQLFLGGAALVLLGLGGSYVVRRSLRPLVEVEETAEAIAAGDLSRRVPSADPRTEVGSLAQSLNTMLGQIEAGFAAQAASEAEARASEERMRRFVGDASHELRTPLTSIRGFAELYRVGGLPDQDAVDRAMARVEGEASRMGLLVEDLLLLARLDQQRPLEKAPVDLLEIATDAVHDARAVDPSRSVELEVVAGGPAPVVQGDAPRLRQVVGNLVSNALTHTPAGTALSVRVSTLSGRAVVDVVDHGTGIAAEDEPRVFERFFRADASRTRASGGSGLGLSIVAALVTAHGGTVEVLDTPGGGATFRVALPLPT